eukprot:scaffold46886_cov28-Tisochrysis_lutea.AAC.7
MSAGGPLVGPYGRLAGAVFAEATGGSAATCLSGQKSIDVVDSGEKHFGREAQLVVELDEPLN